MCEVTPDNELINMVERRQIKKTEECAAFTEDGETFLPIPLGTCVSMNFFAFNPGMMDFLEAHFVENIERGLLESPLKYEDLLSNTVCASLAKGHRVRVLPTHDEWLGVTYQEDKPMVMEGIRKLKAAGVYPERLWG